MAQELAIAKANFSASLFRADPTSLTRPQTEAVFPLIEAVLVQCSRPNVHKCRAWIDENVSHSSSRITALGRYLVALCKNQNSGSSQGSTKPSAKRRRLHLLYLVNDIAHHLTTADGIKSNNDGSSGKEKLSYCWDQHLPALVASAASFQRSPKHTKKLEVLVDLWEQRGYVSPDLISRLRTAITSGISGQTIATDATSSMKQGHVPKDPPYTLPPLHGDSSTPWYDLPAGTWLSQMQPNSTRALRTQDIRPIRLKAGPADEKLVSAVKALLLKVDRLYSKGSKWGDEPGVDVNLLGERIVRDDMGDIVDGDTYYGWSRPFCTQMKGRKKKTTTEKEAAEGDNPDTRSRSMSWSRSRSRSASRPVSHSRASSRSSRGSHGHTRGRQRRTGSRSRSPRRTPSPSKGPTSDLRRGSTRSKSRNRGRSRSPHRNRRRDRSRSRSPSRSRSRSRSRDHHSQRDHPDHPDPSRPISQAPYAYTHHGNPSFPNTQPPIPPTSQGSYPPFPPPPPAGYSGNWPPPPPLPPHVGGNLPPNNWFPGGIPPPIGGPGQWGSSQGFGGAVSQPVPPPPPPPPPPQHYPSYGGGGGGAGSGDNAPHYTAGQYTRGNRGGGGRGRGRGRGGFRHQHNRSDYDNQGWQGDQDAQHWQDERNDQRWEGWARGQGGQGNQGNQGNQGEDWW